MATNFEKLIFGGETQFIFIASLGPRRKLRSSLYLFLRV
jgi:hypothetical protein